LEAQCPHQAFAPARPIVLGFGEPVPRLGMARLLLQETPQQANRAGLIPILDGKDSCLEKILGLHNQALQQRV
jgi:hypothetical protein